ncbi:MAG TPA: DUF6279 family lipoprotein [Gammaproteobacteria bacterium]|jgi:hypothetical protein|nr:hypothetical protein [Gammaproteobacteria bacterium]HJP38535.1 DUF6279 family lipoprotein [Gammaproteobacteria bacterium]
MIRVFTRRWLVLLLCVFLSGCSATRVIYNQFDWALAWYISDYFTLDDEQEDWLDAAIKRNIEWHRRNQLPGYAQLLREFERGVSSGEMTPEKLEYHYITFITLWDEFVVQVMPDVSAFFLMLSRVQVDEFYANLEESNQELWDEYAGKTPQERKKSRQDVGVKIFDRVFAGLTPGQEDLVRSYQSSLHDLSLEWMAGRRQWQQDFRALVLERPTEPEFSARLKDLLLNPNGKDSLQYRQRTDENRRIIMTMIIALREELTDKQLKRFAKRARKIARNLEIVTAQKI